MVIRSAAIFLIVTFAVGWGLPALFVMMVEDVQAARLGFAVVFLVSVFGPALGGVAAAASCGHDALGRHLGFLARFAVGWRWYLATTLAVVAVYGVVATANMAAGARAYHGLWSPLVLLVFLPPPLSDGGPIEELGFRGWLLPLLQGAMSPCMATLLVGVFWFLYHYSVLLPGFPLVEPHWPDAGRAFLFFIQIMALSFAFTVAFNATGGSIPVVLVAHWLTNAAIKLTPFSDHPAIWPLTIAAAALMIGFFGRRYLAGDSKIVAS